MQLIIYQWYLNKVKNTNYVKASKSDQKQTKDHSTWKWVPLSSKKKHKKTEKEMLIELQRLWANTKKSDIHRLGVSKGENKENEAEEILEETVRKNFPNLWKYINS